MLIPVRCFTCNKPIGQYWRPYQEKVQKNLSSGVTEMVARKQALDDLELHKYCCRRMLISHIDIIDQMLLYSNNPGEQHISKHLLNPIPDNYQEPDPVDVENIEDCEVVCFADYGEADYGEAEYGEAE